MLSSRLKRYKCCTQLLPVLCHRSTSLNKKFLKDFQSEAPTMVAVKGNTFLEIYSARGTFHFNKCTMVWGVCDGWTQSACADSPLRAGGLCKIYDLKVWSVLFFPLLLSWIQVLKKTPHLALGNHLFLWWSVCFAFEWEVYWEKEMR